MGKDVWHQGPFTVSTAFWSSKRLYGVRETFEIVPPGSKSQISNHNQPQTPKSIVDDHGHTIKKETNGEENNNCKKSLRTRAGKRSQYNK